MNIQEAKEQIKYAAAAYCATGDKGEYLIPRESQRPVFLLGAPGVGKTAIIEQIAAELGICAVSYSMTQHTRQSAIGLPFIVRRSFDGEEYDVTEYTMSEIIASVHQEMERTGVRQGILFLDEINCVSETLTPVMLQFLQYKRFGNHVIPRGWVIVAAGNPPEYNKSVREFDIATMDRVKRITVEPDYMVWKKYAAERGVHPAIQSYLGIKSEDFYRVETTVDGKSFVTARGWEDLSNMIKVYEERGFPVDALLTVQYLQNERIARDFAVYYDLFRKYRSDYKIGEILEGRAPADIIRRARDARFDERFALIGLLCDAVTKDAAADVRSAEVLSMLHDLLSEGELLPAEEQRAHYTGRLTALSKLPMGRDKAAVAREVKAFFEERSDWGMTILKPAYYGRFDKLKRAVDTTRLRLENVIEFCENAFGELSRELLLLTTELTENPAVSAFVERFGCERLVELSSELLMAEPGY